MSSPPQPPPALPARIEWPRHAVAASARDVARTIIPLVLNPSLWIHRRKETFALQDDTRIRRRITVDITVPALDTLRGTGSSAGSAPRLRDTPIVPVAILAKRPLRDFDLCDHEGRSLPVLTKRESDLVAAHALIILAELALSESGRPIPLDARLRAELHLIVTEPATAARRRLDWFAGAADGPFVTERQTVWRSPQFQTLAVELASAFILLVRTDIALGKRRTVKLAYEEALPTPLRLTWRQRVGLEPVDVWLTAPAIGFGDSYHAEMLAPDDLLIERAVLAEHVPDTARQRHRAVPQAIDGSAPHPERASLKTLATETAVDRMHLMTRGRERDAVGYITLRLRLAPFGLLPATVLIAWFTTLLLAGGLILKLAGTGANVEASAALLVALPALFSIVLTRPGEHQLVRRFVAGLRLLVLFSAAASVAAAAVLAAELGTTARIVVWSAGLLVTLLIAAVTTIAYARARALDRRRSSADTVTTR